MGKLLQYLAIALLFVVVGACSASKKTGDEFSEDFEDGDFSEGGEEAGEQATTDAAPQDDLEFSNSAETGSTLGTEGAPLDQSGQDQTAVGGQSAPVDSGSFSGGGTEDYTVRRGDTLMKIAFETYGDLNQWRKIYELNRGSLADPNQLAAGTHLKIEKPSSPPVIDRNGERYHIKKGDTLGTISREVYGTPAKWRTIWQNNSQLIRDPNRIYAGFYLYYAPSANGPDSRQVAGDEGAAAAVAPVATTPADAPQVGAAVGGGELEALPLETQ